jgi:hypothetical protein
MEEGFLARFYAEFLSSASWFQSLLNEGEREKENGASF